VDEVLGFTLVIQPSIAYSQAVDCWRDCTFIRLDEAIDLRGNHLVNCWNNDLEVETLFEKFEIILEHL
jgi:hypothetical protein